MEPPAGQAAAVSEALEEALRSQKALRIEREDGEVIVAQVLRYETRALFYAVYTSTHPERYGVCDSTGFRLDLTEICKVEILDQPPAQRRFVLGLRRGFRPCFRRPIALSMPRFFPLNAAATALAFGSACQTTCPPSSSDGSEFRAEVESLSTQLDKQNRIIARLRMDLQQAEEALISAESGLASNVSRADAVSALAEARIAVERARGVAPWRGQAIDEASAKLDESDRQIQHENFGGAIFFASRAERMAVSLEQEGRAAAKAANVLWIRSERANLRSGPSTRHRVVLTLDEQTPVFHQRTQGKWALVRTPTGQLGWIYEPLLK